VSRFHEMRIYGEGFSKEYRDAGSQLMGFVQAQTLCENRLHARLGKFDPTLSVCLAIAGNWALCGYPTFVLDGKRAAAYCCTSAGREMLGSLIEPFPAFAILTEPGLIQTEDGPLNELILVQHLQWSNEEYASVGAKKPSTNPDGSVRNSGWNISYFCGGAVISSIGWSSEFLLEPERSLLLPFTERLSDTDTRSSLAIRRLIVGLCLSLDRSGTAREFGGVVSLQHKRKRDVPGYQEFKFTGPVSVDVRKALRTGIISGDAAPLVQTLVRGHWKLQPCGDGRKERKPIHVLPYWRGPLDAPVALRCPQ